MQVGESNLNSLIGGQKQFQVPLYQRQYTWELPQLSQLWEDILEQYDLLTPDEDGHLATSPPTHFLGSLVLAPSPMMPAHGVAPFLVIDGQQRLTSLLIAFCSIRDHAAPIDPGVIERFNELYLVNKFGGGLSHFRLLPTQSDRAAFMACVKPDPAHRDGRIGQAYRFFRAQLTQAGPDSKPLDIGRLETILSSRLQFVAVTADKNENVHRIFESLNDRGVRLTQADLLRNYIFMLLPTKAEEVYENIWRPMQESLTPTQLETLVFVDLVLRGKTTLKRSDIYREQQNRLQPIEHDEAAIEAEVQELARRARLFRRIVQPSTEADPEVRAAFERLERWGASTTYPLLLHLLDLWDRQECDVMEVMKALDYLESFLVRRMIAGVPTNNLNRIFSALVPQIPSGQPISEGLRLALSGERKFWPSDRRLREGFWSQPFYFQGRQDQKMLVFECLERSFKHAEPIHWRIAKLSIEHVMPQSLSEEWREAIIASGDDPDQTHEELLHTIGNLTVTAYNGVLSNNPFQRKKDILGTSHIELNRAIAPSTNWGRAEIQARADDLATRAIELWPGPVAGGTEISGGRDWSRLRATLAALPFGAWTAYGDLAELIGSHQVPVGQYLAATPGVLNAHRVINADGRVANGFRWNDAADDRDIHVVLESEGIRFGPDRRAEISQRLRAEDLLSLLCEVVEPDARGKEVEDDWRWKRFVRYLRHFADAPEGRLHEDDARRFAIQEGYDIRGVGGFYQGNASLRKDDPFRVLTNAGRQFYEENKHRLE